METRPRTRLLRRAVITAALGALVVPASAGAAVKTPKITKVTPKNVSVGETLTIRGKHFRSGKRKNKVLFKRDGGKALFVTAGLSTKKKLKVVIPKTLEKYMVVKSDKPTASRFRLRVLTRKLSKRYTSKKGSPIVGPEKVKPTDGTGGGGAGGGGGTSVPVCPSGGPNADSDGDLLVNGHETSIGTDPCLADSDGDAIWDSYEYWSAVDLNQGNYFTSLPYPGKRPYPNPLDSTDAHTDHDGDVLTLREEFLLWSDPRFGNKSPVLNYSAGKQVTVAVPAPAAALRNTPASIWSAAPTMRFLDVNRDGKVVASELEVLDVNRDNDVDAFEFTYQDLNRDGVLGDNERDVDADGLINYDEAHGRLTPGYWAGVYKEEKPYTAWVDYDSTVFTDPDTDGDGLVDALDDQDHDGVPNHMELSRMDAQATGTIAPPWSAEGRVNPFNPCLPVLADPWLDFERTLPTAISSPTCMRHPPIDSGPAPYDTSPGGLNYLIKN